MSKPNLSLAREFEAALAWWRAAGVDCDFDDDVTAWLSEAPLASVPQAAAPAVRSTPASAAPLTAEQTAPPAADAPADAGAEPLRRNLLGDSPPADLAAFRQCWMDAPGLDNARLNPRIPPRGSEGAALMVLVPQPEEHDRTALLEGPQGRLLGNILAAMGLDDSAVYLSSALPCHTPMADLAAIGASGMDAVLAHHIALAAPQRLLVLGAALEPMIPSVNHALLRTINHTPISTPVMVSETLEAMLHMPRLKARFWRRWIEWSASR
jgi:DNA polymerase